MIRHSAIVLAALVCATPALGADANAGKTTFHQQCALCHSAQPGDNGGAQGPNLNGVFGRHSASDAQFGLLARVFNLQVPLKSAPASIVHRDLRNVMAQRRLLYYASFRPRKSERSGQFRGPCCYSLAMRLKTKVASYIRHPVRAVFHMKSYRPKPCNFSRSASLD